LLVLPGSRRGEVRRLLEPFGETVSMLKARGHRLRLMLPTVPHVAELVRAGVTRWDEKPEIIVDPQRKWQAFGKADAALISSGTVSLELALSGVPMVSCYRLDPIARAIAPYFVSVWSALLPNLIADRALVPEFYNEYVKPNNLTRQMEALFADSGMRAWQKQGFAEIARRMATDKPSGEIAAGVVLRYAKKAP
jgi:lipid-A-disaccharide synthase